MADTDKEQQDAEQQDAQPNPAQVDPAQQTPAKPNTPQADPQEEFVGIKGSKKRRTRNGATPPATDTNEPEDDTGEPFDTDADTPDADQDQINAFLANIYQHAWEEGKVKEDLVANLGQYVKLDSYQALHNAGFELIVKNGDKDGHKIKWTFEQDEDGQPQESISSSHPKRFNEADADAIIALAAVRGWETVQVHGNDKQKDMLWLAAMKQGLGVEGHEPSAATFQKWQEWLKNNKSPGLTEGGTSDSPASAPGGPISSGPFTFYDTKMADAFNNNAAPPKSAAKRETALEIYHRMKAEGKPVNLPQESSAPATGRHAKPEGIPPPPATNKNRGRHAKPL